MPILILRMWAREELCHAPNLLVYSGKLGKMRVRKKEVLAYELSTCGKGFTFSTARDADRERWNISSNSGGDRFTDVFYESCLCAKWLYRYE